jgi:hypothetical protein
VSASHLSTGRAIDPMLIEKALPRVTAKVVKATPMDLQQLTLKIA